MFHIIKPRLYLFIIIIFFFTYGYSKDYELLDRIVVSVEKEVITLNEINREIFKRTNINDTNELSLNEYKKVRKEIINSLIDEKTIRQYAEKINLLPSPQEIDLIIDNILKNNEISLVELEEELLSNNSNLSDFKKDLEIKLIVQKVKDREIMPYVNVSDYEINAWLEKKDNVKEIEYKILHILIKQNNPEKKILIDKLQMEKDSIDFSKFAETYSDGPNAHLGGDLGWKKIEDLPSIFINYVTKAKIGEVSPPIESENGVHFLKIIESTSNKSKEKILVKQYKFMQILLKYDTISSNEEQLQKINNIKNLVSDGLDFSVAVKQYSDDQFNINPDQIQWVNISDLLPEFRTNLNSYPAKKIIGPFKTELGWHLVKVFDSRENDITSETSKQRAKIEIARNKSEIRFKDWMDALKKNTNIKFFEDQ